MKIFLIFPNQLFRDFDKLKLADKVYLLEDDLFFCDEQYPIMFHKQKLVLHRASLKEYADYLGAHNITVEYFDYKSKLLNSVLGEVKPGTEILFYDPVDFTLTKRLKSYCEKFSLNLEVFESPNFVTSNTEIKSFFSNKKRYHQTSFYKWQRERFKILMTEEGKPIGGKLTYDTENRKKLPKNIVLPEVPKISKNKAVVEAIAYVNKRFGGNPGVAENFVYPVNFKEADSLFQKFLDLKFNQFGEYEDAFTSVENPFLFHSFLSSSLNIGLLNPMEIVKRAEMAEVPLNSKEGFIRQIVGWREFMRAIYVLEGVTQRNSNFFKHKNKLPNSFWTGETGILPIDDIIKKLLKYAYSHHIERLMVLGNFMNLSEFEPNEIYNWFMTFYIDAYDWVMVPNVYGMTLFADGGLMTTKPYISSSNYILKMSDYKKADWCDLWDALYWNFVKKHQLFLKKNIRFSMILRQLEKMPSEKLAKLDSLSKEYFK